MIMQVISAGEGGGKGELKPAQRLQERKSIAKLKLASGRKLLVVPHFGFPVLVEQKPIKVSAIRVQEGEGLSGSVLVHPRYGKNVPGAETIEVWGHYYGRNIFVLMDEQSDFAGGNYGVAKFKGAGAEAEGRQLVLHPRKWYSREGQYMKMIGDFYTGERVFGAVREKDGVNEFGMALPAGYAIPCNPNFRLNPMPKEVLEAAIAVENVSKEDASPITAELFKMLNTPGVQLYQAAMGKKFPRFKKRNEANRKFAEECKAFPSFCQVISLCNSDIRMDAGRKFGLDGQLLQHVDAERLAQIDAKIVNGAISMKKTGSVAFDGYIDENRFIDGLMTDLENFSIKNTPWHALVFAANLIASAMHFLGKERFKIYANTIRNETGLSVREILDKVKKGDLNPRYPAMQY